MTQQRVSPVVITSQLPAVTTQTLRAAVGQSANLQEWQSSSGTVLAKVNSAGNIGIGAGATSLSYGLDVFTGSIRVWNGITGAGQSGTIFLGDGSVTKTSGSPWSIGGGLSVTGGNGLEVGGTGLNYGRLSINTFTTTTVGAVIRGAASQTADLQQWQNSAGTVLALVQAGGNIKANNVATINSLVQMAQANSGGLIIMGRQTAAYSNPGANSAALYFRDGTNAGTLKLVVRAGTAGAETTVLDNIPT